MEKDTQGDGLDGYGVLLARRTPGELEEAIITAQVCLSAHLGTLAWQRRARQDTASTEALVQIAEARVAALEARRRG